ncbi:MAG: SPOR domain-containing protein [Campylobacteraceae bacterium]|jgi:DedD protein|nr:SPOR domain-containing protein [Campylobacteraceae bacterium]
MEEKNELSDILLEQKSSNKITQIKRLVVITVLLVLIFMLVILIMKLISKPKSDEVVVYPTSINTPDNEIVVANISIVEEDYGDTQTNETNESNETLAIAVIETNIEPIIQTPPVKATPPPQVASTVVKSPLIDTSNTVKSGHYIQVGSFSNPPNKSFLDNIVKKDYEYHLYKTAVKSKQVTIVLIGPYSSENSARNALLDVKAFIAKDAFYKKMP